MKISVITATYNSEQFIQRCINSVQEQSIKCQHIFVDGLSTDNTLEIIKRNLRKSDKVISAKDKGIYDAFNKGINLADGDIIAILNSDDVFAMRNSLSLVLNKFKVGAEIVYGSTQFKSEDGKLGAILNPSIYSGKGSFEKGWHPPHPSFYALKKCYTKSGLFSLNFPVAADFEIMLRFFEVNQFISKKISDVLVFQDPYGNSSVWKNRLQGYYDIRHAFKAHGKKVSYRYFIKRYSKKLSDRFKMISILN